MDVSFASAAAPGRPNEDLVLASDEFVVVLDGVTAPPPHLDTGCRHDPVWLVRRLGAALVARLAPGGGEPLADLLAGAIAEVRDAHAGTCDLTNPESPASTVAILRDQPDRVDYLVLCDSAVVLAGDPIEVITDDRTTPVHRLTRSEAAKVRNVPGGYWVASADPAAAAEALTGSAARERAGSALVCTDGVTRLVEHFGHTWRQVLDMGAPGDVLAAVRRAEAGGPPPGSTKQHDDATLAWCRFTTH